MLQEHFFWNNSLLEWLISATIIIGGFLAGRCTYWLSSKILLKITARTKNKWDDLLVSKLQSPFIFAIMLISFWCAITRLTLPDKFMHAVQEIYTVFIILNGTWFIARLIGCLIQTILIPYANREHTKIDANISILVQRTLNYLIWFIGIVLALHNIGVQVGTLITGLGIGGAALALAAQDTIKNLFGGITLFFDRPFHIGDRIKIDNVDGYVLDIGLRSLRIRTLDNRLITIPNYKVVDSTLENITSEPNRRVITDLGLTYDTTPEQMELAINILKSLPEQINDIDSQVDTCFMEYGDSALQLRFIYYIKKDKDIYKTRSIVNLEILRQFNANKLEFAFPTQTLYVKH